MGKERQLQVVVAVLDVCRSTGAAITSWWLSALWRRFRLRRVGSPRRRRCRTYGAHGAGALSYDQRSYAQNFDDGSLAECEPDFTARFAPARHAAGAPTMPLAPSPVTS